MEDKITIFDPRITELDYRKAYPEFENIVEFKKVSTTELKLIWYYSNPTSPFANEKDDDVRILLSLNEVYKNEHDERRLKYLKKEFSEKFILASKRMAIMSPSYRARANAIINKVFDNLESISTQHISTFKTASGDTDYGKYVSTMKMVRSELPELIKQAEEGFSIKPKDSNKNSEGGQSYMNDYHNEQIDDIKN